ncbi:zinc finger protein 492-like [Aricia agestis]|uniref:zinc finger protein 492-like n=1 Tax=Aricia agestis TaxID=91739 RepID=UPI001C206158|nr:zinc finger protein 492-like [Aricia agestis]
MSQGKCLVCFSNTKVINIKSTHLQNVYEQLSGNAIQAESHLLCYICYAKLHQCEQLLKQIQKHDNENQAQVDQLVHLDIFNTNRWSLPDETEEIEVCPDIWKELVKDEHGGNCSEPRQNETIFRMEHFLTERSEFMDPSHYDETTGELIEHQQSSTEPDRPYHCEVCNKRFTQVCHLKRHRITHLGFKPYNCYICGKNFSRLDCLRTHILLHSNERPYACDVCGKTFPTLDYLRSHKRIHSEHRSFACDVCQKIFSHIKSFQRHKHSHTNGKAYICDVCDKSFTQFSHLKTHKLIHNGDRPYGCDICVKRFTQLSTLKRHKLTHTGGKLFICDICNKTFTMMANLKTHKLLHTGDKPYTCDICQKKFTQCGNLKTHKLTHTGDKPYSCDVCGKKFTRYRSVKQHKLHCGPSASLLPDIEPVKEVEAVHIKMEPCDMEEELE